MARTSTVVWSVIGIVMAVLLLIAAVYGPGLYQKSQALVGPIFEISQSEERMAELNTELAFTEPADGVVGEDRFAVFVEIRRALLPVYRDWEDMARQLEQGGQEDWDTAMEALAAVRSVMTSQIGTLSEHRMSPAEFIWIEDLAYGDWAPAVDDMVEDSIETEVLRRSTEEDLALLADLEGQHGSSRASRGFGDHLRDRLEKLNTPAAPVVDGIAVATSELFWAYREELLELDLASYSEFHRVIRGAENIDIQIEP